MKKATEAMHRHVGRAITELRRTMNWSQEELAHEIRRHRTGLIMQEPTKDMVSKWEHGIKAPASEYRTALARIAAKDKATEDLAPIFLASIATWQVVSRIEMLNQN